MIRTVSVRLSLELRCLHRKHFQHFVAVVVDDFHGDLPRFGRIEGSAHGAVQTAPGGFIYVGSTISLPYRFASSLTAGSKAKPQTISTSKPTPLTASLAASLISSAPTVPCSGPMQTAARFGVPSDSV